MKIIGLTGPSGVGKSSILDIATKLGFYVIDCDKSATEVRNQSDITEKLKAAFGDILTDEKLDRKKLAAKAFASKEATNTLNNIILPAIKEHIKKEINLAEKKGYNKFLLDAPTLFESGLDKDCDDIIAVLADEKIRAERILKRDNLSEKDLALRLGAAKDDEFYIKKSGYIIYNNGTLEEYKSEALKLLEQILKEK